LCILLSLFVFEMFPDSLRGQNRIIQPALPAGLLARRSGYIFAGTVLSVERIQPRASNEVATVRITFRVDEAIRGVVPRQTLSIREWAGLWNRGERYHPGQRFLLFLYHPGKLGLTSPVGGDYGRFELDGSGKILQGMDQFAGLGLSSPSRPKGPHDRIGPRDLAGRILRMGGKL